MRDLGVLMSALCGNIICVCVQTGAGKENV